MVDLDGKVYKKVQGLDKMLAAGGVPSLKHCSKLVVKGRVALAAGVAFKGEVTVVNARDEWATLAAGTYENTKVEL